MASGTQSYEMTSGDFAGDMIDKILSRKKKSGSGAKEPEPGGALIATPNKSLFVSGNVSESPLSPGAIVPTPGGDLAGESPGSLAVRDAIIGVTVRFDETVKLLKSQTLLLKGGFEAMSSGFQAIALPTSAIVKSVDGIGFVNVRILDAIEEQTDTQKRIAATQLAEQRQLAADQRLARNERRLEAGQDLSDSQQYQKLLGGSNTKGLLPGGGGGSGTNPISNILSAGTGLLPTVGAGKSVSSAVKAGQTGVRSALKLPALPSAGSLASSMPDFGKFVPDMAKLAQTSAKMLGTSASAMRKMLGGSNLIKAGTGASKESLAAIHAMMDMADEGFLDGARNIDKMSDMLRGYGSEIDLQSSRIYSGIADDADFLEIMKAGGYDVGVGGGTINASDDIIDILARPAGKTSDLVQNLPAEELPKLAAMRTAALDDAGIKAADIATDQLVKAGTKQGLKKGSGLARMMVKQFGAAGTKSILKKIPVVAGVAGILFGIQRAMEGDFFGAGLEISSGIMGATGVGAGASLGIDGYLLARDMGLTPFAEGGIVTGKSPVNALIGETGQAEAVMPLTDETFLKFGEGMLEAQRQNERISSTIQAKGMEKFYRENNSWWDGLVEAFRKILPGWMRGGDGDEDGNTNNVNNTNNDGGGRDIPTSAASVKGSTGEQNLAAFLSTMEATGNQNQADAFQVMLNRTADAKAGGSMRAYGTTLGDQVTGREQFSPLSSAIYGVSADSAAAAKYGPISRELGSNPAERRQRLLEIASQEDGLKALQKLFKGGSATDAATVLKDFKTGGELSQSAAEKIKSMISFRGYNPDGGYDFYRGAGGNYFFGQGSKGKIGSLSEVSPDLTPPPTAPPAVEPPPPVPADVAPKNFFLEYFEKIRKKDGDQSSLNPALMTPYQRQQYGFTAFTPPSATPMSVLGRTINQPPPSPADSSNQQLVAMLSANMQQQQRTPNVTPPPQGLQVGSMGRKPTVDQNASMFAALTLQRLNVG